MPRPATKQPKPIKVIKIDRDLTVEIIDWHTWPISRGFHKAREFHYRRELPILEKLCDLYLSKKGYLKLTNVLSTASNFVDWLAFQEVLGDDMPEDTTDIRKHWYPRIKREWGILISTKQQDT